MDEARPTLLTVDDDPEVLRAVERDLRRRYGTEYRVVRADSVKRVASGVGEGSIAVTFVHQYLSDSQV